MLTATITRVLRQFYWLPLFTVHCGGFDCRCRLSGNRFPFRHSTSHFLLSCHRDPRLARVVLFCSRSIHPYSDLPLSHPLLVFLPDLVPASSKTCNWSYPPSRLKSFVSVLWESCIERQVLNGGLFLKLRFLFRFLF
ncbi:hypothetical protein MTR_6g060075 [Medicago truncatula]|uniref:Uncharacterized protein n=1 Tax=Medicago truncatula TaxID=3880 RepID=A0A072U9Y7_MEDTR|nr:hypothetical protein MTR_6g060075 [Medicago truncatula]